MNAHRWRTACSLVLDAKPGCQTGLRHTFAGTKATIDPHPATVYVHRTFNDNKRTFAITAVQRDGSVVSVLVDATKISGNTRLRLVGIL